MSDATRVLFADEGAAYGLVRNVMVAYFAAPATLERMRAFRAAQRETAKLADPVGCLVVNRMATGGAYELGEDVRAEVRAALTAYEHRALTVGISIEGEGLLNATTRAVVSGIVLLARPKYPVKIFGTRRECVAWMLERMGQGRAGLSVDAVLAAVDAATAQMPALSTRR